MTLDFSMRASLVLLSFALMYSSLIGADPAPKEEEPPPPEPEEKEEPGPSLEEVMKRLMEGNKRFVVGKVAHPNQSTDRRKVLGQVQRPIAAIVATPDSRLVPELVFDQGLGDLVVMRVPGAIPTDPVIGGLEYAVEVYKVPLILVLVNEKNVELAEAVKDIQTRKSPPGHLRSFVAHIRPAVIDAQGKDIDQYEGEFLDNVLEAHVKAMVGKLKKMEPFLKKAVDEGRVKVLGARYDVDTGVVSLVEE